MAKIFFDILLLIVGFILLVKGSDFFVDGAAAMAGRFGIPQLIIGLTIVAMGTSAPEAAVSITAAFKGSADITIGNIVGSNILNIFIILGITSVIIPVLVAKSTIRYEIPFMMVCSIALLLLGLDNEITLPDGCILWMLFILYLAYLMHNAKSNHDEENVTKDMKIWQQILWIFGGITAVIIGSKMAVSGASHMARVFGVSERFIGLTIVALGTSLPELFTSVTAARKGNADIAIGNIVGSNIFNILFVVGTTAVVTEVPFESKFYIDSYIMIAATVILLLCSLKKNRLTRGGGIFMLLSYTAYFMYLLLGF